ncbi:hypothetical protein PBY51_015932 [Eleginops maclovinus]|uniref:Uncharacterized protein n=1 Tax=Eleginops maclovinus TaxID=56733 RepID=A0AAN8ARS3_ELEMC|nr:hypothetical protein PBY51_015932 [Eleginops maclovinus]
MAAEGCDELSGNGELEESSAMEVAEVPSLPPTEMSKRTAAPPRPLRPP